MTSEFTRMVDVRALPESLAVSADADERRRLAARFGLVSLERLEATARFEPEGAVIATTIELAADYVQPCAVSGDDLAQSIAETADVRFVPAGSAPTGDIDAELDDAALDDVEYTGTAFDLGEAIAQTLALAIDPFATGPGADAARAEHGLDGGSREGPFAALARLKKED